MSFDGFTLLNIAIKCKVNFIFLVWHGFFSGSLTHHTVCTVSKLHVVMNVAYQLLWRHPCYCITCGCIWTGNGLLICYFCRKECILSLAEQLIFLSHIGRIYHCPCYARFYLLIFPFLLLLYSDTWNAREKRRCPFEEGRCRGWKG